MRMPTRTLKEMIINRQKVRFQFYRDGELWYATECGFEFPVPLREAGTATFLAEDRAILFMRYLRRQLEQIREGLHEAASAEPETQDP